MKTWIKMLFVFACISTGIFTIWNILLEQGFMKREQSWMSVIAWMTCGVIIVILPQLTFFNRRICGIVSLVSLLLISRWWIDLLVYLNTAVLRYGLFMDHLPYIFCMTMYFVMLVISIRMIFKKEPGVGSV